MFGLKRREVRRCENDTLLPKPGLLPHTSQTEATDRSSSGSKSDRSAGRLKLGQPWKDIRRTGSDASRARERGRPALRGARKHGPPVPCTDRSADGGAAYPGGVMRVALTTDAPCSVAPTLGGPPTLGAPTPGAAI